MDNASPSDDWTHDPLIVIGRRLAPLWPAILTWHVSGEDGLRHLRDVLSDTVLLLEDDGPRLMKAAGIALPAAGREAASHRASGLRRLSALLSDDPAAATVWIAAELKDAPQSLYEIFAGPFLSQIMASRAADDDRLEQALSELHRISRQIYFISINASVEANGAGEAGRAFAVIASEIRALSQAASSALSDMSGAPAMVFDTRQTPLAKLPARA